MALINPTAWKGLFLWPFCSQVVMKISSDVASLWETFSLQHDIRDQRKPLFESHLIYRHLTASHKFAGKTISVCSGVALLFGESCSRHLRHQLHDATRDCIVAGWCENRFLQNKKVILSLVIHFRYFGLPKLLLFISSKAKAFRSGTMLYPSPWCCRPTIRSNFSWNGRVRLVLPLYVVDHLLQHCYPGSYSEALMNPPNVALPSLDQMAEFLLVFLESGKGFKVHESKLTSKQMSCVFHSCFPTW